MKPLDVFDRSVAISNRIQDKTDFLELIGVFLRIFEEESASLRLPEHSYLNLALEIVWTWLGWEIHVHIWYNGAKLSLIVSSERTKPIQFFCPAFGKDLHIHIFCRSLSNFFSWRIASSLINLNTVSLSFFEFLCSVLCF